MSKVVKSEINDPGITASAYKSLFHVSDFRSGFDARKDIFASRSVFTEHFQNRLHSLTHGNHARLASFRLLDEKPTWSYFPNLSLYYTRHTHAAKINVITFQPQQLASPHSGAKSYFCDLPKIFTSPYEAHFEKR